MPEPRHREDIIAAVRKRGTTLMALARTHGFARNTLYLALTRRLPNAHVVIAHALGETRHAIWPQWYDAEDKPRFRTRPDLIRETRTVASITRQMGA